MLRFLLLIPLCAYADSIAVEIAPDRHATVKQHYSVARPTDFVYLASPCARVEKIQSAAGPLEAKGTGPWITVPITATSVDLSYEVVPVSPLPRTCALPILMPKHAIESVSMTITDRGSGLSRISVPQLIAHPDSKTWTATFPAVPSHLQLEWDTGNPPPAFTAAPTGRFAWNFRGLVGILVTWTVAYLLWARRLAS